MTTLIYTLAIAAGLMFGYRAAKYFIKVWKDKMDDWDDKGGFGY